MARVAFRLVANKAVPVPPILALGGGGNVLKGASIHCARPSRRHQENGAKMYIDWMARHREVAIALRDVEK